MRLAFRSMLLGLLAFGLVPAAAAAQQAPIQGTFVYVAEGSDNIDRAIDDAVRRMNVVTRQVARPRLRRTNTPYQSIRIAQSGSQVNVVLDQQTVTSPASGTPAKWTRNDGELFDVSTAWRGGSLEQTFQAEDGRRVNVYSLSPDGNTLTLHVTVTSPRLPQPMTYRLQYRRQG
jgi:hypothetical protein